MRVLFTLIGHMAWAAIVIALMPRDTPGTTAIALGVWMLGVLVALLVMYSHALADVGDDYDEHGRSLCPPHTADHTLALIVALLFIGVPLALWDTAVETVGDRWRAAVAWHKRDRFMTPQEAQARLGRFCECDACRRADQVSPLRESRTRL